MAKIRQEQLDSTVRTKIITATRDMTAASGDVSYTGVGFKPTSITCFAGVNGSFKGMSWGVTDSTKLGISNIIGSDGNGYMQRTYPIYVDLVGGFQKAVVKSYDTDGFTLTWTKSGTPTGNMDLLFKCDR